MTRLAVLIGAGPGLGTALAKRFAKEKYKVALIARDSERLATLVKEIEAAGGQAFAVAADVTNENNVRAAFEEIRQQGTPEVLLYNAASPFELKGILEIKPTDFVDHWRINCLGALLAAQEVLADMVKQKRGTIIFTGATASLRGNTNVADFAVGKFSLRALAQSMAREFGPQGVHVAHVIIDGQIATPKVLSYFPNRSLDSFLNPVAIAETFWQLHQQDSTAWTHEMDLRPAIEKF